MDVSSKRGQSIFAVSLSVALCLSPDSFDGVEFWVVLGKHVHNVPFFFH